MKDRIQSEGVIQISRRARLYVADQRPHAHAQTPDAPHRHTAPAAWQELIRSKKFNFR